MNITYGNRWFRGKKFIPDIWDESRARKAHEKRKLYVAVLGELPSPSCFVEINNNYVGIGFLDKLLREYLSYTFDEIEPGRMFLTTATHREFVEDSDKVKGGTTYFFKQDGKLTIDSEDFLEKTRTVKEGRCDVSGNWESYPAFGQYEGIARAER